MPISCPKHWWYKIPVKVVHPYRNIPVKHVLGTDTAAAPAVVLARQDRRNTVLMKHFHRTNANITTKPMKEVRSKDAGGKSTIPDFDWVLPTNVKQCKESLTTFAAINRSIWPYDMTDLSLTKVYDKYEWCGSTNNENDCVKLIRALFNRVMEVLI